MTHDVIRLNLSSISLTSTYTGAIYQGPLTNGSRRQMRGRGVSQMTILFHKAYLVKVTTKGERGGQKYPKF